MDTSISFGYSSRPLVFIEANPDGLVADITEKLIASMCRVHINSEKNELWNALLKELKSNRFLSFHGKYIDNPDYFVFVSSYFGGLFENINKVFLEDKLRINRTISQINPKKSIYIFDKSCLLKKAVIESFIQKHHSEGNSQYMVVYLNEVVGKKIIPGPFSLIGKLILNLYKNMPVELYENKSYYPVTVDEASRIIVSKLLGANDINKNIIFGEIINNDELIRMLPINYPIKLINREEINTFENHLGILYIKSGAIGLISQLIKLNTPIDVNYVKHEEDNSAREAINKTILIPDEKPKIQNILKIIKSKFTFKKYVKSIESAILKIRLPKKAKNKINNLIRNRGKYTKPAVATTVSFFVFIGLPYIFTLLSFLGFVAGQGINLKGNFNNAIRVFEVSKKSANITNFQLEFYRKIIGINLFPTLNQYSIIMKDVNELSIRLSRTAKLSSELAKKMLGESDYDVNFYLNNLSLDVNYLYVQSGFIQGEIESLKGTGSGIVKKAFYKIDFDSLRDKVESGRVIVEKLPILFGANREKTYLILFENNMELRPGGGFIGSFAVAKVEKGRLIAFDVYDVYDADGQLKGYVEPPEPLITYLGVDSWYMRDSNWDPDFSISATKTEWFLDKELNIKVDGVISLDLDAVRSLIGVVGSVYLPNYEKTLDKNNFYEIVQYEAERDFVPGSRRKTNILKDLGDVLLNELKSESSPNMIELSKSIYDSLNRKSIQVFVHQANVQEEIEKIGWAGTIDNSICSNENCFNDYLLFSEANLGSNKSNFNVRRLADMNVSLDNSRLSRTLTIKFINDATPAIGGKGIYKNYLRIIVPESSVVEGARIIGGTSENVIPETNIVNGNLEAGFYFEVPNASEKTVVINWYDTENVDLKRSGQYNLVWYKQPGVESIPATLSLITPIDFIYTAAPNFTLTQAGVGRYNTNLASDEKFQLFW